MRGRTALWVGILVVVATLAAVWFGGRSAPRCPDCNVILVSLDTLRADRLGSYGHDRETSPTIDALAAESIVFSNALAQYTVTKTSHRSLFTSRRRYADEDATWAEILRERGYRTAAFTGGGFMNRRFGHARGFDLYFDAVRYNGLEDLTPRVLDWLERQWDAPFFLFLHTYDVHCPYDPPEPYFSTFTDDYRPEFGMNAKCGFNFFNRKALSPRDVAFVSAVYDGGVRWVDDMLKETFEAFDRLGLSDNSIIVVTSDHGESLGEQGFFGHGGLTEEQIRVPLIMKIPGEPPRWVTEPVSLIDVLPTVLGLLGVEPPPDLDGIDLGPVLAGDASFEGVRPRLTATLSGDLAFRTDDTWKLVVRKESGRSELYDLASNPYGNVIAANAGRARRMERELEELLERVERPHPADADTAAELEGAEPELEEQLRGLGYLE
jgi:arylsulfatase A-like enzyme